MNKPINMDENIHEQSKYSVCMAVYESAQLGSMCQSSFCTCKISDIL